MVQFRQRRLITLHAIIPLFLVSACTKKAQILGPTTLAMRLCAKDVTPSKTVRVVVSGLDFATGVPRDVRYRDSGDPKADDDTDDVGTPDEPLGSPQRNPFHIDLALINYPASNPTFYWAKVRVVLKNPNFTFYQGKDQASHVINGVGDGDPTYPVEFCQKANEPITPTANPYPVRVFYIKVFPKKPNNPVIGTYNIGLVPILYPETPLFIDPKVPDSG